MASYGKPQLHVDMAYNAGWTYQNPFQDPILSYGSQVQGTALPAAPIYQNTPQLAQGGTTNTLQGNSGKGRTPSDSAELMRTSSHRLGANEEYNTHGYAPGHRIPTFPQYLQTSSYGYLSPTTAPPPIIMAQSRQVMNWDSNSTVGRSTARSPGVPSDARPSRPAVSSLPPTSVTVIRPLIGTPTLRQTPATTLDRGQPGQHSNAYAPYLPNAKLKILGNLEAMVWQWSEEELQSRRRLVHFSWLRSGGMITTAFQLVSPDDRPPKSVCISCIYWEEKQEYFVTSVDTVYLLEQLVAAKFTVEEKGRIRRKLEGFRPLTVSKGKSDSEGFFKVIMAFPAPKPRNIEKDIKVFKWKDLASALEKIIGKFSASPSSTMPPGSALEVDNGAELATPFS